MEKYFGDGVAKIRTSIFYLDKLPILFVLLLCSCFGYSSSIAIGNNDITNLAAGSLSSIEKIPLTTSSLPDALASLRVVQDGITLKVYGMQPLLSESAHFAATFSPQHCEHKAHEFYFIQRAHSHSYHGNGFQSNLTTEIIISLDNFNFEEHSVAYLCVKYDDGGFVHLGNKSKFTR